MLLAWPAWILVVCAVASLICMGVGAAKALGANTRLSRHVEATTSQAQRLADRGKAIANTLERLSNADVALLQLVARAQAAVIRMKNALDELRVPQAILALRTAGAAIRLLFSGR